MGQCLSSAAEKYETSQEVANLHAQVEALRKQLAAAAGGAAAGGAATGPAKVRPACVPLRPPTSQVTRPCGVTDTATHVPYS